MAPVALLLALGILQRTPDAPAASSERPSASAPVLTYEELAFRLVDLRWACEEPRPGEGVDSREGWAGASPLEFTFGPGPGSLARVWVSDRRVTIEVLVDGAAQPVLRWRPAADDAALPPDPIAGDLGSGWYSYAPVPFSRSLEVRIRADEGVGDVRCQVEARSFGQGVAVEAATPEVLAAGAPALDRVARRIRSGANPPAEFGPSHFAAAAYHKRKIDPATPFWDGTAYYTVKGHGVIRSIEIDFPQVEDRSLLPQILRGLWVRCEIGTVLAAETGEVLFEMPLGDLFASSPGITPYDAYLLGATEDGTLVCRLPIPYRDGLKLGFSYPFPRRELVRFGVHVTLDPIEKRRDVPPLTLRGGWWTGPADRLAEAALDVPGPARLVASSWTSIGREAVAWEPSPAFAFARWAWWPRHGSPMQVIRRDGAGLRGAYSLLRAFLLDAPTAMGPDERIRSEPPLRLAEDTEGMDQIAVGWLWYGPRPDVAPAEQAFGGRYEWETRRLVPLPPPSDDPIPGALEASALDIVDFTHGSVLTVVSGDYQGGEALLFAPPEGETGTLVFEVRPPRPGEYELLVGYADRMPLGALFLDGRKVEVGESRPIAGHAGAYGTHRLLSRSYRISVRSSQPLLLDWVALRPVSDDEESAEEGR